VAKQEPTDQLLLFDLDNLADRAAKSLSATPRPFLRWAGSKRFLLPILANLLPSTYKTYREPFLGGGALFFLLQPERAVLSDSCANLIDTFKAVRRAPHAINRHLTPLKPEPEYFYSLRKARSTDAIQRAAEFIYLNKTCWNGLYRVNSRGEFNVPYGRPKTDTIFDPSNIVACSAALNKPGITINCADFTDALADVQAGDLVFLDPPYVTGHNNNGFIDYNETLFSWEDQKKLAEVAHALVDRGAHVIVTNADHNDILRLYSGFTVQTVTRNSTLASNKSFRGQVTEAVIYAAPSGTPRQQR
jgi:DNA adenine methylase